jgi:uncharacterized lipoprotein YajG
MRKILLLLGIVVLAACSHKPKSIAVERAFYFGKAISGISMIRSQGRSR